MDKEFWIDKWLNNKIGFHQSEVNPSLKKFWSKFQFTVGQNVFFPLCGKSKDMCWVKEQGHKVIGVELCELAIKDFFHENPIAETQKKDNCFISDSYQLYCQDFFEMNSDQLCGVGAVFDRASMIALPPKMRENYAQHMIKIIPDGAEILLVTIDYDNVKLGPPFAVSEREVHDLYGHHFSIDLLKEGLMPAPDSFKEKGLAEVTHRVYFLGF